MFKRFLYRNFRTSDWWNRRFAGRTTPVGWIVIGTAAAAGALGMDTLQSVSYQTFAFLTCVIVVSVAGVLLSRCTLQAERILPKFGCAGEPLSYRVRVRNPSSKTLKSVSLMEEMADARPTYDQFLNVPEPGEEKRNRFDRTFMVYRWRWLLEQNKRLHTEEIPLPDLPPSAVREVSGTLVPLRRGIARLARINVACPDPFGLFRAFRPVEAPQSLIILPKRYWMPPFDLPGTLKYQQGGVSLASSVGESEEFLSLREYRPGDSLRRIHWKSFAKTGKPLTKEFQDEFFVRHALLLDTFGVPPLSQMFEEAVSVAASLAYSLQNRDSLLDLMFIGPKAFCLTAGRGLAQVEQILEILATVEVCRDKDISALESLVAAHINTMSGCLCVFLTWDEPASQCGCSSSQPMTNPCRQERWPVKSNTSTSCQWARFRRNSLPYETASLFSRRGVALLGLALGDDPLGGGHGIDR